ncbi:protein kinase [Myxococcus sp. CA051A]|nr:protein kinase [Myxococcus sp. CA051A]
MAEVFLARRVGPDGFGRTVAIKRITSTHQDDDSYRQMFADEARLAALLSHRGIAQVYDFGWTAERAACFIVMEFIEGHSLRELLALASEKGRLLSQEAACFITGEIAAALQYAHSRSSDDGKPLRIVHRDVTPHNIMVSAAGDPKLLDFGVAFSTLADREKTSTGLIKGKAAYMSPEQALADPIDGRSDLFSLAIVCLEMLTGRRVFDAGTELRTLVRVTEASATDVASAVKHLPAALQSILKRALERNKSDRYASCGEFRQALRAYALDARHAVGPEELAAEVAALLGSSGARGTTPSRGKAKAAPSPLPTPQPQSAPAPSPAIAPPAKQEPGPATIPAPPASAGAPPAPAKTSTRLRRMQELRAQIANPTGAARKVLVLPALTLLGMLLGGFLVVRVLVGANSAPAPATVEVKTPAQELAERAAAEKGLSPATEVAQLAPLDQAPPQRVAELPTPTSDAQLSPPSAPPAAPLASTTVPSSRGPAQPTSKAKPVAARGVTAVAPLNPPPSPSESVPAPHTGSDATATPPATALRRRPSLRSMALESDSPAAPAGGPSIPAGTLLAARLQMPLDPDNPGPVTFALSAPVTSPSGDVVVPAGATGICTPDSGTARLQLKCDSLTVPAKGTITIAALGYGADRRPGLPVSRSAPPSDIKSTAASTAERLVGSALPGGAAGEVARDAVGVAGNRARTTDSTASPIPKGTVFYLFMSSPLSL